MSDNRAGYDDYCDYWALIRYRGAVASAIRGRRGQAFLRDLIASLDTMPEKRLIAGSFSTDAGVCALGAVCAFRGVEPPDTRYLDYIPPAAAADLGIARALAAEIMYENDDCGPHSESPEQRWQRMRDWAEQNSHEGKRGENHDD